MYEYSDDDDNVTRVLYKYEIMALGLEDSEVILPGMQVDAHVRMHTDGGLPQITFRSRIYEVVGVDEKGNAIPSVKHLKYHGQNWETGGSYLDPTEKDPFEMA